VSDWINHQAVEWAWHCNKVESTAERVTLVSYAKHCDERGYSGVSVRNIASTWHLHHGTVSLARDRLISARLLHETKKRRGQTRQTKVYRLPKIAWESGPQTDALENEKRRESLGKASGKRSPNRHEQLITDKEQKEYHDRRAAKTLGTSTPNTPHNTSDFSSKNYQYQTTPGRDHIKWQEYAAYCRSKPNKHGEPGQPTEKGFWTWLSKQKPQWRNRVAPKFAAEHG